MKAWVLHGVNDLRFEDVKVPDIGVDEILLSVKAAGICGSDIPRIFYTGTYSYPLIPGHEFAGQVAEIGSGVDKKWQGQRVGVFPLIPCHVCPPCQAGAYEMCRKYSYLGSRRDGGFAEYVAVPEKNLIALPEGVSFEEAAMLEPMSVAVHAMRKIRPVLGERIAICGLGTIGLFLLMFLLEAGHKNIYAIGNKEFQRQMAKRLGLPAEVFCDSRKQDAEAWLAERTGGAGADVFFECVGRNETVAQAVKMTAPRRTGDAGGQSGFGYDPSQRNLLEDSAKPADGAWHMEFVFYPQRGRRLALCAGEAGRRKGFAGSVYYPQDFSGGTGPGACGDEG